MKIPIFPARYHQNGGYFHCYVSLQEHIFYKFLSAIFGEELKYDDSLQFHAENKEGRGFQKDSDRKGFNHPWVATKPTTRNLWKKNANRWLLWLRFYVFKTLFFFGVHGKALQGLQCMSLKQSGYILCCLFKHWTSPSKRLKMMIWCSNLLICIFIWYVINLHLIYQHHLIRCVIKTLYSSDVFI